MKNLSKMLVPTVVLFTLLMSACAGAASPTTYSLGSKVEAAPVQFTGLIESMNGTKWVVNGQSISVDSSLVHDGLFNIGDTVKVEAVVQADGLLVVTRVEFPNVGDVEAVATPGGDLGAISGSETPDASNGILMFDNTGSEAFGTVDSITVNGVVIGGQTFAVANGAQFKSQIQAGDFVKVHFVMNADGSMSITQIEIADPALINQSNSNDSLDDNGVDSNDDNGNDSNDDNGSNKQQEDNSGSGGGNDNSDSGGHN